MNELSAQISLFTICLFGLLLFFRDFESKREKLRFVDITDDEEMNNNFKSDEDENSDDSKNVKIDINVTRQMQIIENPSNNSKYLIVDTFTPRLERVILKAKIKKTNGLKVLQQLQ